nr:hypothetical protein [Reyranella sp.]
MTASIICRLRRRRRRALPGCCFRQEGRLRHHPLAGPEAILDLHPARHAGADLDRARLVAALAALDQHDQPPAGIDQRRLRNRDPAARDRRLDLDGRRHVGAQAAVGVGDLDAQPRRAVAAVDRGIDEDDLALDRLVRPGIDGDAGAVARLHEGEVLLVDLGHHPHGGGIDDAEQRIAAAEPHAFDGGLLHDDAARRRADGDGAQRLAALELVQLGLGIVEVAQLVGGVAAATGDAQLLLQHGKLGAVGLEQRLPLLDGVAGGVDEQLVDPAAVPRRDDVLLALVELQAGEGAKAPRQVALADLGGPHAELLDLVGADLHRARTVRGRALADRDVVHVHGILLGHRRGGRAAHRIAVELDLAAGAGRIGRRRGRSK